jgi:hypothetical protein
MNHISTPFTVPVQTEPQAVLRGKLIFYGSILKSIASETLVHKAADDIKIIIYQILRNKENK